MHRTENIRYLDRRVSGTQAGVTQAFDGVGTTWSLPYTVATDGTQGALTVVRRDTSAVVPSTRPAPNQIRVTGDFRSVSVWIGLTYSLRYVPTRIYLRDDASRPVGQGRLTLSYLDLHYARATDLSLEVTRGAGRSTTVHPVTSSLPKDGVLRVPILAQNTETGLAVTSTGPGGCTLTGVEWEGNYTTRSQRT